MQLTEPSQFNNLYNEYKVIVYNTSLNYLQNTEDAEEITQDVFVEVYHSINLFKGDSSLKTWIYRITINKCIDFLKYKKRKKRFAFITSLFSDETNEPIHTSVEFNHPGVLLENKEKAAILFKAINLLPENQKTAFILSRIEMLNQKEIAETMNNSVGAVESLLSRAKENLKKQLDTFYKS